MIVINPRAVSTIHFGTFRFVHLDEADGTAIGPSQLVLHIAGDIVLVRIPSIVRFVVEVLHRCIQRPWIPQMVD